MKASQSSLAQWSGGRPRPSTKVFATVRRALALILTILREIFDESAYERFLVRHQLPPGVAAYARFRCEREQTKVAPIRCC